ncbi:MAG: hypothetical protein QOE05_1012 [Actinomycetota bacterium]|nr:hypothetical protein [Actinomycetota bacterium]
MPSRLVRLLGIAVAVQLVAGLVGVAVVRLHHDSPGPSSAVRGRVAPSAELDARDRAVRALLDARAAAIRDRDRAAWLSTVDPSNRDFVAAQGELFDALADVPISDWTYRLDSDSTRPASVGLDAKRGRGWWAPAVTLSYRITGYDDVPTIEPQRLTFVPRGESWFITADDDFAEVGRDTTRGLWDSGRVVVSRGRSCIVLGHPGSRSLMRRVATSVDAAVPRVTSVWGANWSQRLVVLVPSTQAELNRIIGGSGDFSQIAAVATAELRDSGNGYHPVGDRIVINPPTFAKLGTLGRRVVLTHEVAHVATRAASGPEAPAWLVEGFADYVGYRGVRVPYSASASELRSAVRRGDVPAALPTEHDFEGDNKDLAKVYEEAWLAVTLIAEQHGRDGLLRFYREVGRADARPTAVNDAFRRLWGTSVATFTAQWRHDLVTRLR